MTPRSTCAPSFVAKVVLAGPPRLLVPINKEKEPSRGVWVRSLPIVDSIGRLKGNTVGGKSTVSESHGGAFTSSPRAPAGRRPTNPIHFSSSLPQQLHQNFHHLFSWRTAIIFLGVRPREVTDMRASHKSSNATLSWSPPRRKPTAASTHCQVSCTFDCFFSNPAFFLSKGSSSERIDLGGEQIHFYSSECS
jgi:hypothetical protein